MHEIHAHLYSDHHLMYKGDDMDLPWGDEKTTKFITNVGLITTRGPSGDDIMACEWTHHVSYSPGLVAVCIGRKKATARNIRKTKEFGISLCAADQSVVSSVAGGYSGAAYDKIAALRELGFKFYKGRKIKAFMVEGAAVNIECKLHRTIKLGDHTMFVGEVVAASSAQKEPLAYHKGRYWIMNKNIKKPSDKKRQQIRNTVEKYKK